jgi:hypothetical protein
MIYKSGNYYEGEWNMDKKEGYGVMHWLKTEENDVSEKVIYT